MGTDREYNMEIGQVGLGKMKLGKGIGRILRLQKNEWLLILSLVFLKPHRKKFFEFFIRCAHVNKTMDFLALSIDIHFFRVVLPFIYFMFQ